MSVSVFFDLSELPWNISVNQYEKFVDINHLPSDNYQKRFVDIPVATQIDFSPLFLHNLNCCLPIFPLHYNPLHKIEKLNRETHLIEYKGTDILWVRDIAQKPGSQNAEFVRQVSNWNDQNNLGVVCSARSEFRLLQINAHYRPDVAFKTHAIYNLDPPNIQNNHHSI
ncbi:hypothetical protein PPL_08194 [Heterostelium album PN500]|uniref:Uncharacterized protein n=1 Tax=Heterostelium pallidum (strain ATCC 26659 / Pp 5 / PN500) TaxID=670386 RepID=D3BIV9_HETP5|nr:hypothetical protein PPL_08194 [Heterostelium album PN500]EFA78733.1 hypothetical protein PPL_08194 [Heterostelium album PN500]|eukprot:XP_020430857.1 hypothetical protein PPL_08194 [Heterostelium album PN500]